ncbi:inositol-3-phosphate synthase [Candidatus Korarchaeum cryptofilum]|jgi:myo-inositol-1-phosphate synthase|uniref:Inositol-3-phosphate synthase n=1 Tax=Candidatus Korarchaeum cryptofilum TaxID=498846 RepID=A0A3R9QRG9_9CREN|nr:inositol-3-phosphate synthase [Candidatus Korarchaeum cryptofilum]RSN69722.1 inositol-3-phosphate synthase [Candidatus Korarchaeum cryptofilum]
MILKVKVALAGIGNVASAIVQGVFKYKDLSDDEWAPGIMHVRFGPYHISDIEFVAAFDVDSRKVGKDLSEAIFSEPNVLEKFAEVPKLGVEVMKGPVLDGVAPHMREFRYGEGFKVDDSPSVNVTDVLKESGADVLVNLIPVGSYEASRAYARASLESGVGFVNGIPEFIVSDPNWGELFRSRGIPAAGDDFKSQVGATILHRTLARLFVDRGLKITNTYQLNIGGNMDFLNMIEESRLISKRISKTEAVTSLVPYQIGARVGPSDYVPFLGDRKVMYLYMEAEQFGGFKIYLDVKLSVMDSPNAAGVALDVIRAVKLAKDRGIGGPLVGVSSYFFKHPPKQFPDYVAKDLVEAFIRGENV